MFSFIITNVDILKIQLTPRILVFGSNLYWTLGSGKKACFSDAFCLKMTSEKKKKRYPAHYRKLFAMGKVMRINEENKNAF